MPGSIVVDESDRRLRALLAKREERGKGRGWEKEPDYATDNSNDISNVNAYERACACNRASFKKALLQFKEENGREAYTNLRKYLATNRKALNDEYGDDWKCDENWIDALKAISCEVLGPSDVMQIIAAVTQGLEDLEIFSFGGPDGQAAATAVCDETDIDGTIFNE